MTVTASISPTAQRVLDEAARLFALRGFSATTTRDIANAVGIRQPSLYKHYPSKEAILIALFDRASEHPTRVAAQLVQRPEAAAVRLYRLLHELGSHILAMPFVVATLLRTPELTDRRFAAQHAVIMQGREYCAALIGAAIDEGTFRVVATQRTTRLVFALFDSAAIQETGPGDVAELLEFAFRALLRDTGDLDGIRSEALEISL